MKSRFFFTLLCVGAVGFACGPRARNDAASASAGTTTLSTARTVSLQGAPQGASRDTRKSGRAPITATLDVKRASATLVFTLQLVNSGKKSVELTFPNGQTHDFVILDSLGREVWRWGNGRLFTQALQNTMLSRGASMSLQERWEAPTLRPGRYTAVGMLKSENFPIVERAEFTVGSTALAARN